MGNTYVGKILLLNVGRCLVTMFNDCFDYLASILIHKFCFVFGMKKTTFHFL